MHEHGIDGDAIQPSRELRIALKVLKGTINLDKYVLNDVFHFRNRAEHSLHDASHIPTMSMKQLAERGFIAQLATGDQGVHFGSERGHGFDCTN